MPVNVTPALNPLPLKDNQGGALNLTRLSGIGAAIVALLTTVNKSWNAIFGANAPSWAKPAVLMAVTGAWALIAAADMFARAYAAGRRDTFTAMPELIPAKKTSGEDRDCHVVGMRVDGSNPDEVDYLVVISGGGPEWVSGGALAFPPAEPHPHEMASS